MIYRARALRVRPFILALVLPRPFILALVLPFLGLLLSSMAEGKTIRVPHDYGVIQDAVDAASPGDEIDVSGGRYCGAIVAKKLFLKAVGSSTVTIKGCTGGPLLFGNLRVGFLLPGAGGNSQSNGTEIHGFAFDGKGISNTNLAPLAFGIFARFANQVTVEDNQFTGTVQAITNTAGDGWSVSDNHVTGLTLFDCTSNCGGGSGIIMQAATDSLAVNGDLSNPINRPETNVIVNNSVSGTAPAGFQEFDMDGIFLLGADDTAVAENKLDIHPGAGTVSSPTNILATGILVTNVCCGEPTPILPGSRYTTLLLNDGHTSPYTIVVDGMGGVNSTGLILFGNVGHLLVEGLPLALTSTAIKSDRMSRRTHYQ